MNKSYCLSGTKTVIRRLFRQDMEDILSCYEQYKQLYYNPINETFIINTLLYGEIWGAYVDNSIVACCYYLPLNSSFYAQSPSFSAIADFTENTEKYFLMGYVGIKPKIYSTDYSENPCAPTESGLYHCFLNIAQMQGFRRGHKYILHAMPVKLCFDIETLFRCGYKLIKLRGLENLVVHYIFAKAVFNEEDIYCVDSAEIAETTDLSDTKKVSALLESGYICVDLCKKENKLYFKRLVTD